jgi:hypothetical protein
LKYDKSLIGKTVTLIKMNDKYTKLQAGDKGIVESIDQHGYSGREKGFTQIWVRWNKTDHLLALIPEADDKFEVGN